MEKWKKQIEQSSLIEWEKALSLREVVVDESNQRLFIWFDSTMLASVNIQEKMKRVFMQTLPATTNIDLRIRYSKDGVIFCDQFIDYVALLRESIAIWQPGLAQDLANISMELQIETKILTVRFKKVALLHLWNLAKVTDQLVDYVYKTFSCNITVDCILIEKRPRIENVQPIKTNNSVKPSTPTRRTTATPAKGALYGKPIANAGIVSIHSISDESGQIAFEGEVFKQEKRETGDKKKTIFLFSVTDQTDSIQCKLFLDNKNPLTKEILDQVQVGKSFRIYGEAAADKYSGGEVVVQVRSLVPIHRERRCDDSEEKRVELHIHTQMSTMDSTISVKELIDQCVHWGQKTVAITDHGVVQAFPQFYDLAKKAGIKAIFGMEGYLNDDSIQISQNQTYVVFDLETTGLKEKHDQITEIGAVKLQNGCVVERFSTFVNPGIHIPKDITELTGITNEMVANAPMPNIALKEFYDFCEDSILVAHNAKFDMKFILEHGQRYGIEFTNNYVDTLIIARYLLRDLERHRLNDLTEYFNISLENHHRADCDAEATAHVLLRLIELLQQRGIDTISAVTPMHYKRTSKEKNKRYHIVFLVKNHVGLQNLYQLVTYSHLNHYQRRPTIPRSLLCLHREGLIVGSACSSGELYDAIIKEKEDETLRAIASFYDYLEIQPIGNNDYLLREGIVPNEGILQEHNKRILALADEQGKRCVATTDAHFSEPEDAIYRSILMASQKFSDADQQPALHMKTTEEMLAEFSYLGEKRAHEVVIENTNYIADQCEMLRPFPKETCQPVIEGAEEELTSSCYEKAHEIYGDTLPNVVKERLEHELNSITKYGFSVLYVIARKLVLKSNEDGYLVGSRGSVGSSVVAFFSGITEVNALQPHYICPHCKYSDFDVDLSVYACGCDLPEKACPVCGNLYEKDGYNIPFETFLGFEGDKVPDIDLNFSGEYQPVAHKYTEELFGKGHVFRAGTISGVQEKTAYGFVRKYVEEHQQVKRRAELERLSTGCCGVKRTTGQHPGGIVVVPMDRSVFEFTPLQHPADRSTAGSITTHFDFNSMHDTLVKLDILGHDDPTMIRMLQDLTGIDPKDIPLDDPETMSLFSGVQALGVDEKELGSKVGTFGVPEFGTSFVRRMLVETQPKTMEELVRISGLSHGTDVWTNNAQNLVRDGTAVLSEAICTRDDIMTFLIRQGMDKKESFDIMERVRKGKGLTDEMEAHMKESGIPAWYIDSCKKIKYMFPRAHAAAYVMMAFRIAYCKVHYPLAYYTAYFSIRADALDIRYILGGDKRVKRHLMDLQAKGNEMSVQDKALVLILELVIEMNLRGIEFENVDIMRSDATKCIITGENRILPPINAIAGLGEKVAQSIVEARKDGAFSSQEEMQDRCKIGQSTTALLEELHCLDDMPKSDQFSFFM